MTELSRERIAEILRDMIAAALGSEAWDGGRTGAEAETAPAVVALRAALDAYEAQRPRGAGEVPESVREQVLVRHASDPSRYQPAWYEAHARSERQWLWGSRDWIDPAEILSWLPLPKGGEDE